jgi:hypothetical protein
MSSPACPDWVRRIQASSPVLKLPNAWGIVRVAFWPI